MILISFLLIIAGLLHIPVLRKRYNASPMSAYSYAVAGFSEIVLGIILFWKPTTGAQILTFALTSMYIIVWIIMESRLGKRLSLTKEQLSPIVIIRKTAELLVVLLLIMLYWLK